MTQIMINLLYIYTFFTPLGSYHYFILFFPLKSGHSLHNTYFLLSQDNSLFILDRFIIYGSNTELFSLKLHLGYEKQKIHMALVI